jgi:hypothetical protein
MPDRQGTGLTGAPAGEPAADRLPKVNPVVDVGSGKANVQQGPNIDMRKAMPGDQPDKPAPVSGFGGSESEGQGTSSTSHSY